MTETVHVTVSGLTGSGKSAVMGEIEIALRALGLKVEHDASFQTEKNMTHADWQEALDLYQPTVMLTEVNVSRASEASQSIDPSTCGISRSEMKPIPPTTQERIAEQIAWSAEAPPKTGAIFYGHTWSPYRWKAYSPKSEQFRRGLKGRWQAMNEHGGWDNAKAPNEWATVAQIDARRALIDHREER